MAEADMSSTSASSTIRPEDLAHRVHDISIYDAKDQSPLLRSSQAYSSTASSEHRPQNLSFDAFAAEVRLHNLQRSRLMALEQQQTALQRALALSARLSRTVSHIQDGLVEALKNGDKSGFASAYHTAFDLRDTYSNNSARNNRLSDSANVDEKGVSFLVELDSASFMHRLPAGPQADVLDFVHLLRTSPSFLVDRIKRLNHSQISTLASFPNKIYIPKESPYALGRGTSQTSQHNRNAAFSKSLRDTGWSLERTTPLSALLFNIYSAVPTAHSEDWQLRLDTWSTVCADLFSSSDQDYHYLLLEVLNAFASFYQWRAKQRIELFLMDLLQTGAFLLEPVEDSFASDNMPYPISDPLRTHEAEEFFENAVTRLFGIVNDSDGGIPHGALRFSAAVLGKLSRSEEQSAFRGFLLYSWYCSNFLYSALRMPETKGMLLNYHVSKEARNSILKEVAIRAQSRVAGFLDPMANASPIDPAILDQLKQMVSCFVPEEVRLQDETSQTSCSATTPPISSSLADQASLTLSISDLILLIDVLVPQPPPNLTPWDSFLASSATAFANQYRQGLPSLSKIFPADHNPSGVHPIPKSPLSQSSALTLARKFEQMRRDLQAVMERRDVYPLPHPAHDLWAVLAFSDGKCPTVVRRGSSESGMTQAESLEASAHKGGLPPAMYRNLSLVGKACVRLANEQNALFGMQKSSTGVVAACRAPGSLESLFAAELEMAEGDSDSRNARYWWAALSSLRKEHPLCVLSQNDTQVLRPLLVALHESQHIIQEATQRLEISLRFLEEASEKMSNLVSTIFGHLERLRDKMWYLADIINSRAYEDARNVARALRNMAVPPGTEAQSPSTSRGDRRRPRSLAESLLEEPEMQTMNIMKAPLEQGGPKKLADEQVELTRRWFQNRGVENFCRGEERIHRFCIEIKSAASRLVGESMTEGPVLWSSELYNRERPSGDGGSQIRSMPGPNATRPSSIISEDGCALYTLHHQQGFRSMDVGSRPPPLETQSSPGRKSSFHSLGSERWKAPREAHGTDGVSSGGSPARAVSATTSDSVLSSWSLFATQPQSTASASSLPSRPPSMINDVPTSRPVEQTVPRRSKFLEELRRRVTNLLLSDLASPVWSCGSETDAWIADVLQKSPVKWQLQKRECIEPLIEVETLSRRVERGTTPSPKRPSAFWRSPSSDALSDLSGSNNASPLLLGPCNKTCEPYGTSIIPGPPDPFPYHIAYEDLMDRFSRQADPVLKLDILHDLKSLVVSALHERRELCAAQNQRPISHNTTTNPTSKGRVTPNRRRSWGPAVSVGSSPPWSNSSHDDKNSLPNGEANAGPELMVEEKEIVREIKLVLIKTRPKTLFRDLQFITAFVSPDILNSTAGGKAFLHVGLAALAFKDDVCRGLVSVAGKILATDGMSWKAISSSWPRSPSSRSSSPSPLTLPTQCEEKKAGHTTWDAAQMWILAAKEGNAIAQRELATLYLSGLDYLPAISLPLAMPRDVFRPEMKYYNHDRSADEDGKNGRIDDHTTQSSSHSQAMCLALHWMQLAANNGDTVAQARLKEREAQATI